MTGIRISHLPPGERERAKQGWTCHLNPSSLLILHSYPSLHPSACSFFSTRSEGCHLNPASLIALIQPLTLCLFLPLSVLSLPLLASLSHPKWHVTAIIALRKRAKSSCVPLFSSITIRNVIKRYDHSHTASSNNGLKAHGRTGAPRQHQQTLSLLFMTLSTLALNVHSSCPSLFEPGEGGQISSG